MNTSLSVACTTHTQTYTHTQACAHCITFIYALALYTRNSVSTGRVPSAVVAMAMSECDAAASGAAAGAGAEPPLPTVITKDVEAELIKHACVKVSSRCFCCRDRSNRGIPCTFGIITINHRHHDQCKPTTTTIIITTIPSSSATTHNQSHKRRGFRSVNETVR